MKFVKGQSGNLSGKPPGTINKTNRLVKEVFSEVFNDLQSDPRYSLRAWAEENPNLFYALVTKLIPVQMDHAGEIVQRIIIEDAANCQPLLNESNAGI